MLEICISCIDSPITLHHYIHYLFLNLCSIDIFCFQLQAASLLFVDNPVGTGFSYVDEQKYFTHDVAGIASDMMGVLKAFFMEKSPQFQEVPFYIFSESYGGKMTAAISQALYQVCAFKYVLAL